MKNFFHFTRELNARIKFLKHYSSICICRKILFPRIKKIVRLELRLRFSGDTCIQNNFISPSIRTGNILWKLDSASDQMVLNNLWRCTKIYELNSYCLEVRSLSHFSVTIVRLCDLYFEIIVPQNYRTCRNRFKKVSIFFDCNFCLIKNKIQLRRKTNWAS